MPPSCPAATSWSCPPARKSDTAETLESDRAGVSSNTEMRTSRPFGRSSNSVTPSSAPPAATKVRPLTADRVERHRPVEPRQPVVDDLVGDPVEAVLEGQRGERGRPRRRDDEVGGAPGLGDTEGRRRAPPQPVERAGHLPWVSVPSDASV
jgi:hypothetical protein